MDTQEILGHWPTLNDFLRKTTDEATIKMLLDIEVKGKHRPTILLRLYARYSTLRRKRELREVLSV